MTEPKEKRSPMSESKSPREFWINYTNKQAHEKPVEPNTVGYGIEVIEKSAYEELKKENETLQTERSEMRMQANRDAARADENAKECSRLKKALEFYADKQNWQCAYREDLDENLAQNTLTVMSQYREKIRALELKIKELEHDLKILSTGDMP